MGVSWAMSMSSVESVAVQCGVLGGVGVGRLLWFIDTTLNIDTERGRLVDSRYHSHFKPFETMFLKKLERVTKIYLTVPQSIYVPLIV